MSKLRNCLSEIIGVEVFGDFDSLTTSLMEGGVDETIEVLGVVGECVLDSVHEDNFLPPSFMVCTDGCEIVCFSYPIL